MRTSATLLIEPDTLYWARLDRALSLREHEALRYAFEPALPVPLEDVETRFTISSDGAVIGCAIEHTQLEQHIAAHAGAVESIRPTDAPEWLTLDESQLIRLEFRSGAYRSPAEHREQKRKSRSIVLCAAAVLLLLLIGIETRRTALLRSADAYDDYTKRIAAETLDTPGTVDPLLMLTAERRRLTLTRSTGRSVTRPQNAGEHTISLLAAWPDRVPTRVEMLDIRADAITIRGTLRDSADFDSIRTGLSESMIGWEEATSDLTRAQRGFDFSFTLAYRADEESP